MKKFLSFILIPVVLLSFTACGKKAGNDTTKFPSQEAIVITEIKEDLPQCTESEKLAHLAFAQNTSIGTTISISEEKPYWGMLVENSGDNTIRIDMGLGENIIFIKPSQKVWIYSEFLFGKGEYQIGFSSDDMAGMDGFAAFWSFDSQELLIPQG